MYGMGLIGGFCHLYIGQEAVVVGMQMALKQGDAVITGYRDHGHMLACNMDPKGVMAELTGRRGGYSHGKGGSMHMFSVEKGFYGGHGIVGAQVSLGTGLAFAHRYRKNDNVSLTYFGDGAANQGQVYESFNMAELWKLPVIYIIENNRYAMGTAITRSSATTDLSKRGASFNIPGEQVDGMDVRAVKAAGEKAVAWCRAGKGPYILEMLTYRYRGHSMSDPAKYRTREEVQKMRTEHDPIEQVRVRMLEKKIAQRGRAEEDRRRGARSSSTRPPNSPPTIRSRMSPSSGPTCTADGRASPPSSPISRCRRGRELDRGRGVLRAHAARDRRRPLDRVARVVAWPFAIRAFRRAGAADAANVNKALVAFIACILVGVAAFSASANLHRFAK